jgi:hypothetical protein
MPQWWNSRHSRYERPVNPKGDRVGASPTSGHRRSQQLSHWNRLSNLCAMGVMPKKWPLRPFQPRYKPLEVVSPLLRQS